MATRNIPRETLRSIYEKMLLIRMVEEKIVAIYPEQQIRCPVHLCIGEEAIAAAVCENLTRDDYLFSNHRSHGHYLAKGGDLKAMMAEMYGKATGCSAGMGGSMHLVDLSAGILGATPIVGGTIPVAVGAALASSMMGRDNVTVVFFGDGAVEEGVFYESVNFAVLKSLPVLFICENNFYSVYTPLSLRQPPREIYDLVRGHGIESLQVDGNDALEIYRATGDAVKRARNGKGPTFLECKTYRWREHCGPNFDNTLGYRTEAEFEEWKVRRPVDRMRDYMLEKRLITPEAIERMTAKIAREIEEAVKFAKESPFPKPEIMSNLVYADND